YGIPVPAGAPARSVREAADAARRLAGEVWMVKAQVHAGGRGKAGGVRKVDGLDALQAETDRMLGTQLITDQGPAGGQPVNLVLIEQPAEIARELYLGAVV
ncbi:MAG: succinate--CoA ligase subunit beta, partial [Gammaproteobacteria bacterium]|nr:succinate--CoA ligase subunit beta [Gammaproteobacteria bacterium]NIR97727.1 succinate--CoA ligase subunit beta [Gammaproteobacteria bacterium]NIT63305.1 succinate--CoA ligase subunit beta [Gammaproteobacteria bacterium]NIV20666.1 succinate--CoA ligase subunit beta [Gammaproteobacteria bacterium]NIX11377.1 succinate--CoA ligase subunit beta [Gammaproteobacteria bacterium]